MIKDTDEYKDLCKMQELHDSYKKHAKGESLGYNVFLCKKCGLPVGEDTGRVHENPLRSIFSSWGFSRSKKKLSSVSPAAFTRLLELGLARAKKGDGDSGLGSAINLRMQQLKDQLDLTEFRAALLKDAYTDSADLVTWATMIECKHSQDIYTKLLERVCSAYEKKEYSRHGDAEAVLAYHQSLGVKPDYRTFKLMVAKFRNHDLRPIWSRLAGKNLAVSFRFRGATGALRSYQLAKDTEPKLFNNIERMTKLYGEVPEVVLAYYQDTGRIIGGLLGEDVVIKSKIIDKAATPSDEDRKLIGEGLYKVFYGTRAERLANSSHADCNTWMVDNADSLQEYLGARYSFDMTKPPVFQWRGPEDRGFGEDMCDDDD